MFCRNCGKELIGIPELCMNCGARPLAGNTYCSACGAVTNPLAEICIKCGTAIRGSIMKRIGKNKTTAVLLAVFLSYWTWLYTYRKDAWKFWIGTGIVFILVMLGFLIPYDWISNWIRELGQYFWGTNVVQTAIPLIILMPLWVWSIVDTARKSDEWYHSFPGGRTATI